MNYKVVYTRIFEKEFKRLAAKYPSLKKDFSFLLSTLESNPFQGTPLGNDCYKIRLAITSKGKGKSGGARVITCVKVVVNTTYLVGIYDKSEKESISIKEIQKRIEPFSF